MASLYLPGPMIPIFRNNLEGRSAISSHEKLMCVKREEKEKKKNSCVESVIFIITVTCKAVTQAPSSLFVWLPRLKTSSHSYEVDSVTVSILQMMKSLRKFSPLPQISEWQSGQPER